MVPYRPVSGQSCGRYRRFFSMKNVETRIENNLFLIQVILSWLLDFENLRSFFSGSVYNSTKA